MARYSNAFKQKIAKEYIDGKSVNQLATEYGINYITIRRWTQNLPDNWTSRSSQKYEICDDHALIYLKYHGGFKTVLIDIEDVEKCQQVGIWSLGSNGYVMNCKTGLLLHRFVMNCPYNLEVDHIYHNLLDCRKSMLRLSNSSQQKMNTKLRKDNTSGHRGVYFDNNRQKWCVNIKNNERRIMKRFDTYDEACLFCDQKLVELHKEFKYQDGEAI